MAVAVADVVRISERTSRQLQQVATQRAAEVSALAEQIIRDFLREEAQKKMGREMEAFRAMHAKLLTRHKDEYVAVHQKQVIDHDSDQLALFLRVDEQYPDVPILIKQVRKEVEEVVTIRSPRFEYV